MMAGAGASPYELASDAASRLGIAVGAEELATLASDLDLGDGEMAAVAATFSYLAEKRRLASIETLLRLTAGCPGASPRPSRASTSPGSRAGTRPRWASSRRWPTSTRTATSPSSGPAA